MTTSKRSISHIGMGRIPAKAEADGLEVLVGLILGLFLVGLVVTLIVMAAPSIAGAYWLRHLMQRYEVSIEAKGKTVLIGLIVLFLALPLLLATSQPTKTEDIVAGFLLVVVPMGIIAAAMYLSYQVERRLYWGHRKASWAAGWQMACKQFELLRIKWPLCRVQYALERVEQRTGDMHQEFANLKKHVERLILENDTVFFSAEQTRYEKEFGASTDEQLEARSEELDRILSETSKMESRYNTYLLEASIVRLERQKRLLAPGKGKDYESAIQERDKLQAAARIVQSEIETIKNTRQQAILARQQAAAGRPVIA